MQTIFTSLQADNHTNTSALNFFKPDALFGAQPTVWKHWRHFRDWLVGQLFLKMLVNTLLSFTAVCRLLSYCWFLLWYILFMVVNPFWKRATGDNCLSWVPAACSTLSQHWTKKHRSKTAKWPWLFFVCQQNPEHKYSASYTLCGQVA